MQLKRVESKNIRIIYGKKSKSKENSKKKHLY